LTAAYLQEIALQLRYRPQEKVLKLVARMNELTKAKDKKDDDPDLLRGKKDPWRKAATPV
jgi:hypothetical protein